jgi:hypothetical protein
VIGLREAGDWAIDAIGAAMHATITSENRTCFIGWLLLKLKG